MGMHVDNDFLLEHGSAPSVADSHERSQALPHPWIESFDPTSGMAYYFNTETQLSSWEHPALLDQMPPVQRQRRMSQSSSYQGPPLHDAVALDADMMPSNGTDVEISAIDLPAAPVQKPWVQLVDPTSGVSYYFNTETQLSSWHHPTQLDARPAAQRKRRM